jgi:integrase
MAPRVVGRLTSRRVSTARPKAGRQALIIGDGGGLWLQVTRGAGDHLRRSWTFRYEIDGKRHEMGLGALHTFSLAEARARARALRQQLADGIDPLEAREATKRAKLAEQARTMTFRRCAGMYLDLHQDGWKSAEHREQWASSLRNYIFPVLGDLSVADIDQAAVMKVVQPIWNTKTVTAARVRGRIEAVLDYAAANGFRGNENPARHVLVALPKKAKITTVEHYAALAWEDVPAFMVSLRALQSTAARCLEYAILTAARSDEAIGALWDEINFSTKTWAIPATRMKAGVAHDVPLSGRALEILRSLPRNGPYVFGGRQPLVKAALRRRVLHRLNPDITVHGFRTCFRTWAAEATNYPEIVAEHALAHSVGSAVERAYKRTTLMSKRRQLMAAWGGFCTSSPVKKQEAEGVVTPLRRKAEA